MPAPKGRQPGTSGNHQDGVSQTQCQFMFLGRGQGGAWERVLSPAFQVTPTTGQIWGPLAFNQSAFHLISIHFVLGLPFWKRAADHSHRDHISL